MMTADMEDLKRRFLTIEKQFAELKGQMMGDGKPTVVVDNSTRTETTEFNATSTDGPIVQGQDVTTGEVGTQPSTGRVKDDE